MLVPRMIPLVLFLSLEGCAGCGQAAVCNLNGPINDPTNRTLRRQILAQGLGEFCKEMTSRGAPLRMADDSPVIGRYFASSCQQQALDSGDLLVKFDGWGFAWTNVSKKVTFLAGGTVQYNQDFRCADDNSIYAYFPPRQVVATTFTVKAVERAVPSPLGNWAQPYVQTFGQQLLTSKLREGFTVIRDPNGGIEFSLGILAVGQHPPRPFGLGSGDRTTVENARSDVHQNQRDFIGPIRFDSAGSMFLNVRVDGAPAIDLLIYGKGELDPFLHQYFEVAAAGAITVPPRFQAVVQGGVEFRQAVRLPAGTYYVVLDNTATAGQVAPPSHFLDDRAATVSYAIQIGDTP